jgi:hypothetical protein
MGRGRRLRAASNKEKVAEEDQEKTLAVIENQEFVAMRAATTARPAPSTKEELQELVDQGLIQEKNLADWRAPGEHYLNPREIILFIF